MTKLDRYNVPAVAFCLALLAYIIAWFYALIFHIIPILNTTIANSLLITWLQVVTIIIFFTLGLIGLIACIAVLGAFIFET